MDFGEAAELFAWRVHAYVVMSNHFHLGLELMDPNLSEGMKWLPKNVCWPLY